jgi:thiamine-phosphate pyrophosphorylase
MARCYSVSMPIRHLPLPDIWLVSDARNDVRLDQVLRRLPRGSGFIFRHYHVEPSARRKRFAELAKLARMRGHVVVLSGPARQARYWKASGAYGPPALLGHGPATMRLATAHSLREIGMAHRARAQAILLSPTFPTRSHPDGKALGSVRFRLLAARSRVPVIALGGMSASRSRALLWKKWAAIDGI